MAVHVVQYHRGFPDHRLPVDQHKHYRNIARIDRSSRRNVHDEHTVICDAALAKDVKALCAANEQHIRRTAEITGQVLVENLDSDGT